MFKYCINRGRFVSVDASIKSDAKTGASERKRPFKLTSERASRRDDMKVVRIDLQGACEPMEFESNHLITISIITLFLSFI